MNWHLGSTPLNFPCKNTGECPFFVVVGFFFLFFFFLVGVYGPVNIIKVMQSR